MVRDDGVALGWGICRTPGLSGRSREAAQIAASRAMASAREAVSELHIGTLNGKMPEGLFPAEKKFAAQVHLVGEHEGALNLAGHAHGIVVLAGTGAIVYAQLADGRIAHLDGLGPLLGDWGSGYQIGRMALRAAVRSGWHPRHRTALEHAVLAAFGVSRPGDMVPISLRNLDRSIVAALANEVDRLANTGDAIARGILEKAACDLSETLRDVVESLDLSGKSLPLVGTGSVAKHSEIYWRHFRTRVAGFAPDLVAMREPLPSAAGMALAILCRLPGVDPEIARNNLFDSVKALLNNLEKTTQ